MRISDEPDYQNSTISSGLLSEHSRERFPKLSSPDSAYDTNKAVYSSVTFGEMPHSQPLAEYERTFPYSEGQPARPSYIPVADQDQFRQQPAAMPADPQGARYAGQPAGNYTSDTPGWTSGPQGRKKRGNLPEKSKSVLSDWFNQHTNHPYPKEDEKQRLSDLTGLSISQVR